MHRNKQCKMFSPDGKLYVKEKSLSVEIEVWSIERRKPKELLWTRAGVYAGLALTNDATTINNEGHNYYDKRKNEAYEYGKNDTVVSTFKGLCIAVVGAVFSPSALYLALHCILPAGTAAIRVYEFSTALLLAEKNNGYIRCFYEFLSDYAIWLCYTIEASPVYEWMWQTTTATTTKNKILYERRGQNGYVLEGMSCDYSLCFCQAYSDLIGVRVMVFNRKDEFIADFTKHTILALHGPYVALRDRSTERVMRVYDLEDMRQRRLPMTPVFTRKRVSAVSRCFSMALTFETHALVDLVGSKQLIELYLLFCSDLRFSFPLYVVLLIYDWLSFLRSNNNSIEAVERWQHAKKVEVLLQVQKSVAAVKEKRSL